MSQTESNTQIQENTVAEVPVLDGREIRLASDLVLVPELIAENARVASSKSSERLTDRLLAVSCLVVALILAVVSGVEVNRGLNTPHSMDGRAFRNAKIDGFKTVGEKDKQSLQALVSYKVNDRAVQVTIDPTAISALSNANKTFIVSVSPTDANDIRYEPTAYNYRWSRPFALGGGAVVFGLLGVMLCFSGDRKSKKA